MSKRYWLIRGYNSTEEIFKQQVGLGQFTENQIKHVLRALAAKEGLSLSEIVGAYATRGTTIANDRLAVQKYADSHTYTCGSNPFFTASVVDENGKVIPYPTLPQTETA